MDPITNLVTILTQIVEFLVLFSVGGVSFVVLIYMFFQFWINHGREKYSLEFVHLLVALPKDNEIKIDKEKLKFWLKRGAKTTLAVDKLFKA